MRSALPFVTLVGSLLMSPGCTTDPNSMMDNMGGGPGQMDASLDRGMEVPDGAGPIDVAPALALGDLQAYGAWQSYHVAEADPLLGFEYDHPVLRAQLIFGWRHFDFHLDYNNSGNGVFEVYHYRLGDNQSHCRYNLGRCLEPMAAWSAENPGHAPIVVLFLQNPTVRPDVHATLDLLERDIVDEFDRGQIFTPADARAEHPGLTLRQIMTEHGGPSLERARGKFIFVVFDFRARASNRDWPGWGNVDELQGLLWNYADGDSEEELAASDAAFAMLGELTDDAAQAHARGLVERGYIVRAPAHDAESYARAVAAGVHLISSKWPIELFPWEDDPGWPVACNPVTAPDGCHPRQIDSLAPAP